MDSADSPEQRGQGEVEFGADDVRSQPSELLYQGFFRFEKRHFVHRRFDGGWSDEVVREVHVRYDAVGVLLYDPGQDCVVMVEQVRAGVVGRPDAPTPWLIEPVAGLIDSDECPEQVARRETMEEAGCTVDELIPLYAYYPSPGASTERIQLYCALIDSRGVGGVYGLADEQEDIRVHVIAFRDAWLQVESGGIDNAMALIALQWLARERATLRARSNR